MARVIIATLGFEAEAIAYNSGASIVANNAIASTPLPSDLIS